MCPSKTTRAAAEASARDPHEIDQLGGKIGFDPTKKPKPKQQPPKQAAAAHAVALRHREKFRSKLAARVAAKPKKVQPRRRPGADRSTLQRRPLSRRWRDIRHASSTGWRRTASRTDARWSSPPFATSIPAGHQMRVSIGRKLQGLRDLRFADLQFEVVPIALTVEQVRELRPPLTPLKPTERRGNRWRAEFGVEQTEIDALATLRPRELQWIVEEGLSPYFASSSMSSTFRSISAGTSARTARIEAIKAEIAAQTRALKARKSYGEGSET